MDIIRKGFITFKKDFYIAKSYPVRFLILLFEIFFQLAILFFFAKFLESSFLQSSVINIENFFAYFLLGICVLDVSNTIVSYLSIQVEEYKKTGVFEELFILPVDSTNLLILSSAFPIFLSLTKLLIYMTVLMVSFDGNFDYSFHSLIILLFTVFSMLIIFIGISLIACSMTILFYKGSWISVFHNMISIFLGGVFYPSYLILDNTSWVQYLIPIHNILEILRSIFDISELTYVAMNNLLIVLTLQSSFFLIVGFFFLKVSIRKSMINGNISHY